MFSTKVDQTLFFRFFYMQLVWTSKSGFEASVSSIFSSSENPKDSSLSSAIKNNVNSCEISKEEMDTI